MNAELLHPLWHATLLASLALIVVLALRGPWLRCFGPGTVLLPWLILPASLLALFVPAPVRLVEGSALPTLAAGAATSPQAMPSMASTPVATVGASDVLLASWLVGAVLLAAFLTLRQWRYRRALGHLEALPDGSFRSQSSLTGPALVGALRPRIVVPADFDQRFTPEQRSLILAHERCHLRRGDAQFTLLACAIRCLFWFNPLVHLAWSRFRVDQELACDAAVLRRHPDRRREYAEALLATQAATPRLPVGCTWLTGSPLKRRITMLYTRPHGKFQLLAGTFLALTASTAAAVGAWSSQEPQTRYLPAAAPPLELASAMLPVTSEPPLLERGLRPATIGAEETARLMPPTTTATVDSSPPSAESSATTSPRIEADNAGSAQKPSSAPAAQARPAEQAQPAVDVEPARLVEAGRPSFPRGFGKPELVGYPGMPESERPGPQWQPEGSIWLMELRVTLDENGEPTGASIANNDLSSEGFVRRYERLALRAVKRWGYEPARIDGEPVASELVMAFQFDTEIGRVHDFGDSPYAPVSKPHPMRKRYTRK